MNGQCLGFVFIMIFNGNLITETARALQQAAAVTLMEPTKATRLDKKLAQRGRYNCWRL